MRSGVGFIVNPVQTILLAVGLDKYRMFAVLLWALRVHPILAAARFSSIVSIESFLGTASRSDAFSDGRSFLRLRVLSALAVGECLDIVRPIPIRVAPLSQAGG